jgi:hypothetical protein
MGSPGAAGATGPTGPQGVFNNLSYPIYDLGNPTNSATLISLPSNTTDHFFLLHTADSDTILQYNVQLPSASTAGQVIAVLTTDPYTNAYVAYEPASGDTLLVGDASAAHGTFIQVSTNWAQFVSDGNHNWYLLTSQ